VKPTSIARIVLGCVLAAAVCLADAQDAAVSDAAKPILAGLRGLRSLSDTDRVVATKNLALQIRKLPAGKAKLSLANSLANLSTEGDFGRDTLQAVTDTLAQAVKETPAPEDKGKPAAPYMELAQLNRYEHMRVRLKSPEYDAALVQVDALDKIRASADFTLSDIQGNSWTLSSLKGKVVLVNFWATWCPPCRKEMPDLNAFYARFKDQGLVILAISDEDMATVKPFIDKAGYTYPILLDPGRKVNTLYQVDGIPKSFVYDREGKLVAQSIDMRTQGQFMKMLELAGLK
jgi:peroxiredoxin